MRYRIALVVGRFQPFHKGHLHLLKKSLVVSDKIIIAVGSSNVSDENNPLSYKTRVKMLEKVIIEEGLRGKILKIIPSPDDPSDDIWLQKLLKNAGKFDIVVGNNDWTNDILEKAGFKILKIKFLNRKTYQGVIIRELFRKNKKWQNRVPKYLTDFIQKEFSKSTTL
ncbi:MAG: adenylyltransferase/cytidyltransferase family protein [Patescibacteria group bacterium]